VSFWMTRQTGYPPDIYPGYRCNDANISTHGFVNSRHMESHMDHALSVFFDVHADLPREGPGNRENILKALTHPGELPVNPKFLDNGCVDRVCRRLILRRRCRMQPSLRLTSIGSISQLPIQFFLSTGRKGHPVYRARSMFPQRIQMHLSGVSFVSRQTINRVYFIQNFHFPVASHLGQY